MTLIAVIIFLLSGYASFGLRQFTCAKAGSLMSWMLYVIVGEVQTQDVVVEIDVQVSTGHFEMQGSVTIPFDKNPHSVSYLRPFACCANL